MARQMAMVNEYGGLYTKGEISGCVIYRAGQALFWDQSASLFGAGGTFWKIGEHSSECDGRQQKKLFPFQQKAQKTPHPTRCSIDCKSSAMSFSSSVCIPSSKAPSRSRGRGGGRSRSRGRQRKHRCTSAMAPEGVTQRAN